MAVGQLLLVGQLLFATAPRPGSGLRPGLAAAPAARPRLPVPAKRWRGRVRVVTRGAWLGLGVGLGLGAYYSMDTFAMAGGGALKPEGSCGSTYYGSAHGGSTYYGSTYYGSNLLWL